MSLRWWMAVDGGGWRIGSCFSSKKSRMVRYVDVGRRHVLYACGFVAVLFSSCNPRFLLGLLFAIVCGVVVDTKTPVAFSVVTAVVPTVATVGCVAGSVDTWWYAHTMSRVVAVPPWLPMLHVLFAHWALDAYWLVTLRTVRKETLP